MSDLRITFILNGKSGSCDAAAASEAALRAATARGAQATIHVLKPDSDVAGLVRAAIRDGAQVVVGGGGDGTIGAVAAPLVGTDVTLGVLPLGTLNHFAKDLKIPLDLDGALANLFDGEPKSVDTGEVNGLTFINNSGVGLYPAIVQDREALQKRGLPKWAALAEAAVRKLAAYSMVRVALTTANGQELVRSTPFVFVGNNRYGVSGGRLGQRERLDCGHLWICMAPQVGRMKLAGIAFLGLIGRLRERDLVAFEAASVSLATRRRRQAVSHDGEVVRLETPLDYRIRPQGLRVIVPRVAPELDSA